MRLLARIAVTGSVFLIPLVGMARSAEAPRFTPINPELKTKAIYGSDDRKDWKDVRSTKLKMWAKSTMALINVHDLEKTGDAFKIKAPTYETFANLCPGTQFGKQLTPGFCSGFLVGPDLILTAGHCISNLAECNETAFVFDFAVTDAWSTAETVQESQIYKCKELISRELNAKFDYALIQLDHSPNRPYFPVRRVGQPVAKTKLTMIGHPAGLPSKISDGGEIVKMDQRIHRIIGSVDAFGGNSGSVVINRRTGRAEGILVAGEPDFEPQGACMIEKVCGPECDGEEIFPVSLISHLIPE